MGWYYSFYYKFKAFETWVREQWDEVQVGGIRFAQAPTRVICASRLLVQKTNLLTHGKYYWIYIYIYIYIRSIFSFENYLFSNKAFNTTIAIFYLVNTYKNKCGHWLQLNCNLNMEHDFVCQNQVYVHKLFKVRRYSFRGGVESNRFHCTANLAVV